MRRLVEFVSVSRKALAWTGVCLAVVGTGAALKFTNLGTSVGTTLTNAHGSMVDTSASLGMRLNALTVEGRDKTPREELLAALDIERGAPILSIDVAQARTAVEALPWVKTAKVERRLPDAVHIMIEERTPYALWQRGKRYTLVDCDGKSIVDVPTADQSLPLIVGPDAPAHVADLFDVLRAENDLAQRVRAAVRVGDRRWNIYLDSFEGGIAVRLPEEDMAGAWTRLATLERDHKILERDLDFIDLRLEDRLVVRVHKEPGQEPLPAKKKSAASAGPKQNI